MSTVALKRVARVIAGQSPPSSDVSDYEGVGLPFLQGNAEFGSLHPVPIHRCDLAPKRCSTRDVLLSVRAPVGALNIADQTYGIGRGLCAIRPHPGTNRQFLWWALNALRAELDRASVGSTYAAVTAEDVDALPIPRISESTQRAIADFLDAETARIDALIARKRQLAERLNQRLSIEHERLVLGQDQAQGSLANGRFYGETAWPETTLRHLNCEVQTGPFGSQLHADDYVKDGWPVVNPSNIVGGRIIALAEVSVDNETRVRLARHLLKPGDIVFGRRGEMGRAGLVSEHEAGWICGTGSLRLRLVGDLLLPEYLKLLLETGAAKRYFELSSVGSTMDNLNTEILLALPILVPPIDAQKRVVRTVSRSRAHNLELETKLSRSIGLLTERRQALITAAVTGQIEVPGAVAS